jgi:gamma-glutamylcysteine synthetase
VCEVFWDWWMPDGMRVGIPAQPFQDITDYVHTIARLRPIYVKREGKPVGVMDYKTFAEYYQAGERARGIGARGREVPLTPRSDDIDQHGTFYWYNARISRYYTLENRVNDQQPPGELLCVPALTLGVLEALPDAGEIVAGYDWHDLAAARGAACRHGLEARSGGVAVEELAERMLGVAQAGLERRGLGEEQFLQPLWQRLEARRCPADDAAETFAQGGIDALVGARRL